MINSEKVIYIFVVYIRYQTILGRNLPISTKTLHSVTPTTLDKVSDIVEGPCFGGLYCVHGKCRRQNDDSGDFTISECSCEPQWFGLVCDQRRIGVWLSDDQFKNADGLKVDKIDSFQIIKALGDRSMEETAKNSTSVDFIKRQTDSKPNEDEVTNLCGFNYKIRSIEQRACTRGLRCVFGTCSVHHEGSYIAYTCNCDIGAIGILCENKCCLDCGEHGNCRMFENGTQFCNCRRGYGGENCQYEQTTEQTVNNDSAQRNFVRPMITGLLITTSFVVLTSISIYLIWRRWLWGKTNITHCNMNNKDFKYKYMYDVIVWYHFNDADDKFVKQVLLPLLEQSTLTFSLRPQMECSKLEDNETEDTFKRSLDKSYRHIVMCTSTFIQNCCMCDKLILRNHELFRKNRLICLCPLETLKLVNHRHRVISFLFGNVNMLLPESGRSNDVEVKIFKEKLLNVFENRKTFGNKFYIGNILQV